MLTLLRLPLGKLLRRKGKGAHAGVLRALGVLWQDPTDGGIVGHFEKGEPARGNKVKTQRLRG